MRKSPELFDLTDVCVYFGLSESSVRRRVRAARNGTSNFPLPLFSANSRVLWKRADIESWNGEETIETTSFILPPVPSFPKATQTKTNAQVREGLKKFGIELPPPARSELLQSMLTQLQENPKKKSTVVQDTANE